MNRNGGFPQLMTDPGEANDLREQMPDLFADMKAAYRNYTEKNGVLEIPEDYDQFQAIVDYATRRSLKDNALFNVIAGLLILTLVYSKRTSSTTPRLGYRSLMMWKPFRYYHLTIQRGEITIRTLRLPNVFILWFP